MGRLWTTLGYVLVVLPHNAQSGNLRTAQTTRERFAVWVYVVDDNTVVAALPGCQVPESYKSMDEDGLSNIDAQI